MTDDAHAPRRTGLVLSGGGARAAYQVGVLRAVMRIRREAGLDGGNPFPVLTGTSAGAINAAALAASADDMAGAVERLHALWHDVRAHQVYRTDSFGVARTGARWMTMLSVGWALARHARLRPHALLDNAPLHEMIERWVPLERVPSLIADGHLHAVALGASSYTSGRHVTFYQGAGSLASWARSNRLSVRAPLTRDHLLASAAIPFMFPAMRLSLPPSEGDGTEWFGDGSMRQTAPLSPAIHLGADRLLAIGAGRMREPPGPRALATDAYPSLAQIGGHALSSIFLDALAVDIERLQRINGTLMLIPPETRRQSSLRPLSLLLIAPSQRLDDIAARHLDALPGTIRALLRAIGVRGVNGGGSGAALASYLLFEPAYTRELLALGEADAMARRVEVEHFFRD